MKRKTKKNRRTCITIEADLADKVRSLFKPGDGLALNVSAICTRALEHALAGAPPGRTGRRRSKRMMVTIRRDVFERLEAARKAGAEINASAICAEAIRQEVGRIEDILGGGGRGGA